MIFTIEFIRMFSLGLYYAGPILLFLILLIVVLGLRIGHREGWSRSDALYFSFITATTVGYGDFSPQTNIGKFTAIIIAFLGLIMTGIVVALGVKAGSVAFHEIYNSALS